MHHHRFFLQYVSNSVITCYLTHQPTCYMLSDLSSRETCKYMHVHREEREREREIGLGTVKFILVWQTAKC